MNILAKREAYLIKIARSIYESATQEENSQRLELHRLLAVHAASLFDNACNEDGILHTDLGLELILFIELKKDKHPEAETDRIEVLRIIEQIEDRVANSVSNS